eukprot:2050632-Alexandrium_andersonii.AAC.1
MRAPSVSPRPRRSRSDGHTWRLLIARNSRESGLRKPRPGLPDGKTLCALTPGRSLGFAALGLRSSRPATRPRARRPLGGRP